MDLHDKIRMAVNIARGSGVSENETLQIVLNGLKLSDHNQATEISAIVARVFAIPEESFRSKWEDWFSFVKSQI